MTRARLRVVPAVAVVVLLTVTAACGGDGEDSQPLPSLTLPALAGFASEVTELDLSDLDGPAVVNFWATWCGPCRTELPAFQTAQDAHPDIRFIGVDTGFDTEASVKFLGQLGMSYDQFSDPDGALAEALRITQLPTTVIVDADGDVTETHTGAMTAADLDTALTDLAP